MKKLLFIIKKKIEKKNVGRENSLIRYAGSVKTHDSITTIAIWCEDTENLKCVFLETTLFKLGKLLTQTNLVFIITFCTEVHSVIAIHYLVFFIIFRRVLLKILNFLKLKIIGAIGSSATNASKKKVPIFFCEASKKIIYTVYYMYN